MSLTNQAAAHLWLDAYLGDARSSEPPLTFYIALLTGDPRDGGVEVAGSGYARVALANTTAVWGPATGGQKSADAVFPDATGTWTTARWWAAADTDSSTDWVLAGQLSERVRLTTGDTGPTISCVIRPDITL
jgi:hypothetical protein